MRCEASSGGGGVARHTQDLDTTVHHHAATIENGGWGDLPIIVRWFPTNFREY